MIMMHQTAHVELYDQVKSLANEKGFMDVGTISIENSPVLKLQILCAYSDWGSSKANPVTSPATGNQSVR